MKKIIMIAIVLIATINTKAQNKIKGKVLEISKNGEEIPIIGANVYWEGTTIGTATDLSGSYSIQEATSFPATLNVSFVGYTLDSKETIDNKYIFYMRPSIELDEVKVKGKVNTTKVSTINPINIQTLSTGELEKAACCNLSESFSTNATVDVTFTDAVSGAKQIQMLGLDGIYTQITQENIPLIRGMSSSYGLSYVPGTWIESIQIIKGSGSVINGFESFTGQLNLEYYKPESAPKLFWNAYVNQEGKLENNLLFTKQNGDWQSNLFTHISYFDKEIDRHGGGKAEDGDDFIDVPKTKQVNILNRWKYKGNPNYGMQLVAKALIEERLGGQSSTVSENNRYIVDINNSVYEIFTKTGFIQPNIPGKSIGLQTSFRKHNQTAIFGENHYKGRQESAYLNLIRQTYLGNTNHILKYGMSYYADRFTESFDGNIDTPFSDKIRVDLMTGIFSEYAFKWKESLNLVAGIRSDYYNNTEEINYLPRLNIKYNPTEQTAIRLSAGKAIRISNVFVENASFLATNRQIFVGELTPELAWNYGINVIHCFKLFGREGTINADYYKTEFENQVIVDVESQGELSFYNLDGESFASSMQFDVIYELFDRFDIKMAYKLNDVQATFDNELRMTPLTPKERALINLSYATNFEKWKFDITANYIGESRVPLHDDLANHTQLIEDMSNPFYLFNAQITKRFRHFDLYVGGENLGGYFQENPIIASSNPSSDDFDASLIWAPIQGRMFYLGFRYKIK